jgi:Cu-processing system ATP-binding protein
MSVLEFNNVTKFYNKTMVLNNISFNVGEGNIIALVGHNGAGKTTLIKLLLGLISPSKGNVKVLGLNTLDTNYKNIKKNIGFLPETVAFKNNMSGLEILNFFSRLKDTDQSKNIKLLEEVGLEKVYKQNIKTYSKGMMQRLGLAQALLGTPRILLLDEPTNGLDPILRLQFYELLSNLKEKGVTILISSHALTEIENKVDKLIIINEGNIVANGPLLKLNQKAELPIYLRFKIKNQTIKSITNKLGNIKYTFIKKNIIEFKCSSSEKINVIKAAFKIGLKVEDIEIESPSMSALYKYYINQKRVK